VALVLPVLGRGGNRVASVGASCCSPRLLFRVGQQRGCVLLVKGVFVECNHAVPDGPDRRGHPGIVAELAAHANSCVAQERAVALLVRLQLGRVLRARNPRFHGSRLHGGASAVPGLSHGLELTHHKQRAQEPPAQLCPERAGALRIVLKLGAQHSSHVRRQGRGASRGGAWSSLASTRRRWQRRRLGRTGPLARCPRAGQRGAFRAWGFRGRSCIGRGRPCSRRGRAMALCPGPGRLAAGSVGA